jgi:aspartate/methionine/tyrosine aminotransferase
MLREYIVRSELIKNGLNENDGISCLKPTGTFYAFHNIYELSLSS